MRYRDEVDGHRNFALPGARLHYGPDKTVIVEHIDLHLEPDLEACALDGIVTTTVRALDEPVADLELNAVDIVVSKVEQDERPLSFTLANGRLQIRFDPVVQPGERAQFRVAYRVGRPRHGLFFVEPNDAYPSNIRHAWTQSQDENARYWFPCLDYPHSKQTTSTTIVVPSGMFALGNGALVERRDEGNRTRFTYRQDVPHSTYLVTMVVGPFSEIEQRRAGANQIPVWYYVLPGREADGERAFGNTPAMIETFEDRLRMPYPYARYSQIAVADFIFGGMENTSATTQTERTLHDETAHLDFSSDPLVSHELAHQWFGDLLTCRDWSQAWLNEGFATFFECIWREANLGRDEYLYDVFECVARYVDEDAHRYRRPIVCNRFRDPIELFDRHLYEKGAAVLHMLRGELGESRFWRSIVRYVRDNAGRNVETIDLIRAIEEETGRNVRAFFDQWVFRAGHPELDVRMSWDSKRNTATLTIDQTQLVDDANPAYRFEVDAAFRGASGGERVVRIQVERQHETVAVPLDEEPVLVRFDPGAHLLANVTYKLGCAAASGVLQHDPDIVARIRAARELAKDGSQPARESLASAFRDESFWGVLAETAAALGATKAPWARELLLGQLDASHPKVRRAVASALGNFRRDDVAAALIARSASDPSYFVRHAALTSLGRTRDVRAFEALSAALRLRTWNGVVEAGAAAGLGELGDARALEPLVEATRLGREEGLRRAAVAALARMGELVAPARARIADTLGELLDDPMFLVQLAAIAAAERLGEEQLIPDLERLGATGFDGRVRRDAVEAASRIRESLKVPAQVSGLRSDLDAVREDQRSLQEKIEAISRA